MTPDLSSYLDRWEQAYQRGEDLTPAELCPDRPDLAESLAQGIEAIRRMRQLAESPDMATLPPSQADSAATVAPSDPDATIPPVFANGSVGHPDSPPGYEILGELGRGGMGVVYKARQAGLGRVVALKMILSGSHAGVDERVRFLAEAEAIARVRHAGIVQVYDFGTHENRPFFSLEFCEGGSLADRLAGTPMAPAEAARLVEQIARAVQAAHDAGVVHRDLKPANVLLVESASQSASRGSGVQSSVGAEKQPAGIAGLQPKVTDFGLAKRVEGGSGMTQTGAVMGTPSYMAPEQAEGRKDVGPAADVYALGAILYECLTGRPPFRAASAFDTLMQVVSEEPVPPRQLNAKVPVDLETITLRCLCKEPSKRYSSAGAAADDLRCFVEGRPIQARPVGRLERLWRWARREPVLASLTGSVAALLLLGSVVAWTLAGWALGEAGRADNNAQLAEKREKLAEEEKKKAEMQRDRAEQLVYVGKIAQAQQAWEAGDALVAFERLDECQWNLRGWEHDQLWTQFTSNQYTFQGHTREVTSVAWSPDGKRLASASYDKTVKVWDAATGQEVSSPEGHTGIVSSVAWSPDGKRLASASHDNTVKVWDASTGQQIYSLKGHTSIVTTVAWSPDGKRLASASLDTTVKVWEAGTGQEVSSLNGHTEGVTSVAWSPDGKWLASASADTTVKVWDTATGQQVSSLKGHISIVYSVAWSPDGKRLASASHDKTVKVWDAATGQQVSSLKGHTESVYSVAWSPDGKRLASASHDKTVKVWDAATGQQVSSFMGHTLPVSTVVWSPDGKRLASASGDKTVKVWDAATGQQVSSLLGHTLPVSSVAWSPDGKRLASGSHDNTVKVWDVSTGQEVSSLMGHTQPVTSVAWSPDGKRLVTGSYDKTVKVWDPGTGKEIFTLEGHIGFVYSVAWSPDGKRCASASSEGPVKVWDAVTGKEVFSLSGLIHFAISVEWSPDGKRLASGSEDDTVKVWDAATGQQVSSLKGHTSKVFSVVWSPDGKRLASASGDKTVKVWDAATGQQVSSLLGHTLPVSSVAWSPDGKRLASGSHDNTVKVWDVSTGQEVSSLMGHTQPVTSVAWSPDGKRLVTGSYDKTVKVWDGGTNQAVSSLKGCTREVTSVAWSPDSKQILGQDQAGNILAWEATTGKLVPDQQTQMPPGAEMTATSPDRRLRAFARGDTILVEHLSEAQRTRDRAFLELMAHFDADWHLAQVVEAEDAGNPFAAAFHLGRLLGEQPWNATLHVRQAHALPALERPAEAARHLAQALLLAPKVPLWPDDPDAGRRASLAIQAEDWPRAARVLLSVTRLPGSTVQTHRDLLLACLKAGDRGGPSRAAEALLRDGPQQNHLPVLLLATLDQKDVRKLVEGTGAALARQRSAANLGLHGMALYRAEQFEQAFKVLTETAKLDQTNPQPTVWLYQAMVARQLNKVEEARTLLVQFDRWYASNPPGSWQDRAMFSLLRDEAGRLVEGPPRMPRAGE